MVNIEALSNFELFQTLNPSTLRAIAVETQVTKFDANIDLYRQGDPPTGLFALQTGRVKLCRQSRDKFQILAVPQSGDCFGAESLSTGSPNPYSATTLTSTTCIVLHPDALQALLNAHPDFQEAFLKLITDRVKQFVTLVHDLAFRDVTSRLAMVLVSRAELEGQQGNDGIYFDRLLSQQEFAAMVGTAREVIYRTFKKFEQQKLIRTTRDTIYILDLPKLRDIAAQENR